VLRPCHAWQSADLHSIRSALSGPLLPCLTRANLPGFRVAQKRNIEVFWQPALLRFDVCRSDNFAPFLSFVDDELGELGGRQRKRCVAKVGDSQRYLGIGEREIDFPA
jgi:hypothetical protein